MSKRATSGTGSRLHRRSSPTVSTKCAAGQLNPRAAIVPRAPRARSLEFQDQLGASSCKTCSSVAWCAEGTQRNNCGSPKNSAGACEACVPGRFKAVEGVQNCKKCPIGQHQSASGKLDCTDCMGQGRVSSSFKFQDQQGKAECKFCNLVCNAGYEKTGCDGSSPGTCTHMPSG